MGQEENGVGVMEKPINNFLLEEVKKKAKELAALREISKEITASLDVDHVLNIIMDRAIELLSGTKGCILLFVPHMKELRVAVNRGLSEDEKKEIITQAKDDISKSHLTHSVLHTPLKYKDTIIGVIHITNGRKGRGFTKRHLETLQEFADQAAIAIDNARSHQELKCVALNTIKAFAKSIDERDHYTSRHSENVARYSVAIAKEMNLEEEEIEKIRQAAELHDIGKIGISDYILSKPGKLTLEEWKEIKKHPIKGVQILNPLFFLNGIIGIVKQHHERPDGKGYPEGLKGNEIMIGAKIMAVADSYDAMTTDRPYRAALSRQEAVDEIKHFSGTMYDSQVVKAFLRVLGKKAV